MRWWHGGGGCGTLGAFRRRTLLLLVCCYALLLLALPCLAPRTASPAAIPARTEPGHALLQSEPASMPTPATFTLSDEKMRADEELLSDAARRLRSLPLEFWHRHKDDMNSFLRKRMCAPFPSVYELEFTDTYWQTLRAGDEGTFHLFGAYLDARNASRIGPAVRLLAVHDRIEPKLVTHCQLWFEGWDEPVVVRALEYKYVWNSKWGNYRDRVWQPYLVACVLPASVQHLAPAAVSLVQAACDRATTLLRVHYERPTPTEGQREFAVCVKGLDFLHKDLSLRLIEWLELLRLLGAAEVHMYKLQVHANVSRVLEYYERAGLVTVTPVTLPGGQPNLPALQHMYLKTMTLHKRQMELIPYNDCLYKHMYRFRWLALLDVDEMIVPLRDGDWSALMRRVLASPGAATAAGKPPRSSYYARNLYYLDSLQAEHGPELGAPPYMHMTSHVWRTRNFSKPGFYVKAFHETARVLTLHNHFALACLGGTCSSYALPPETARLQHYRAGCACSNTCAKLRAQPVRDAALWRWREQLIPRVTRAALDLGLIPAAAAAANSSLD